jgi:hypothetical protein
LSGGFFTTFDNCVLLLLGCVNLESRKETTMVCSFEFRRHSIKDGACRGTIGPRGFALAREVGRQQLRGRAFTGFFASALWRTHQTLVAFDEGAGDFNLKKTPPHAPIYLDWPEMEDLWRRYHRDTKSDDDLLVAALTYDASLTAKASTAVAEKFTQWARSQAADVNILVVGHSPYMELIPYGLWGLQIPSLKECQGFRIFSTDGGAYRIDWQSPNLDPADIRRRLSLDVPT